MLHHIADESTNILIRNQIIEEKNRAVYVYGFELAYSSLLTTASIFTLSLALGRLPEFIYFIIFFFVLRCFTGGYHAKTYFRCFLLTNGIYVIYLLAAQCILGLTLLDILLMAAASGYIIWKAPVEHKNHRLSLEKRRKNRRNTKFFIIFDFLILVFFYLSGKKEALVCEITATVLVAVMMIKHRKVEKK